MWSLDVSQPCGPPRPVTGLALPFTMKVDSQIGTFCILTAYIPYGDQSYQFWFTFSVSSCVEPLSGSVCRHTTWQIGLGGVWVCLRRLVDWSLSGKDQSSHHERCSPIRNNIPLFWAESRRWRSPQRWSRLVCCLALCAANHLVKVRRTPTTLLLLLAFPSRARACAVMYGARKSKCVLDTHFYRNSCYPPLVRDKLLPPR
jgi:hypothetical protein